MGPLGARWGCDLSRVMNWGAPLAPHPRSRSPVTPLEAYPSGNPTSRRKFSGSPGSSSQLLGTAPCPFLVISASLSPSFPAEQEVAQTAGKPGCSLVEIH